MPQAAPHSQIHATHMGATKRNVDRWYQVLHSVAHRGSVVRNQGANAVCCRVPGPSVIGEIKTAGQGSGVHHQREAGLPVGTSGMKRWFAFGGGGGGRQMRAKTAFPVLAVRRVSVCLHRFLAGRHLGVPLRNVCAPVVTKMMAQAWPKDPWGSPVIARKVNFSANPCQPANGVQLKLASVMCLLLAHLNAKASRIKSHG